MSSALRVHRLALAALLLAALTGCAAERLSREGQGLIAEGRYEEGVAKLEQAAKAEPSELHYRTQFINKREEIANKLLAEAANARIAGDADAAGKNYRRVLAVDPANERAKTGLEEVERDRRHALLVDEAQGLFEKGDLDGALAKLQPVALENPANSALRKLKREIEERQAQERLEVPRLKSLYTKPVSLEFRDANLKLVFDVLSRTTGINFIFDKEVRPDLTTSISVKQTSLENVVDLLLTTNQLEKKVLNSNTVLIYPNTPAKLKEFQDLQVKSFYIENADAKQTMNMIKTLLKTRDMYVDEKLNLLVMRDSPEAIELAGRLIAMQDLAEPEVMLEMQVLEVTRSRLLNLGIQYPQQLTLTPLPAGTSLTLQDLKTINATRIGAATGSLAVNAQQTDGDVNLLANPRIRVRDHAKAKVMIGDRVPVITTTSNATGFVSDSVQYVDAGLKLEVEPKIYLNDDVAINVSLEVSSITNQVTSKNGTLAYQIGTRNASTVLRLKDGETQVLAGLVNDNDRATANKVPGLGDLPLLGRLFSSHNDDKQKTEIVLSITPHIIRNLKRPDAKASEFWSGSDSALRTAPLALQPVKAAATEGRAAAPATAVDGGAASGAATADAGQPPTAIALSWKGPQQVKAGEQFQLTLNLKANGGLRSMPFQFGYDPAALKVVEVAEGDFFKQNGAQTSFTNSVDSAAGKVYVGVVRTGAEAAMGEGSLATVTFKALPGKSKAEVKLLAATPVAGSGKAPAPDMPDAYVLNVAE